MAEQKWTLTSIVSAIILLSVGGYFMYSSDYKFLLTDLPDQDVFILKYDSGDKIEIVTRSDVCSYALFRVTKKGFAAKCGYRRIIDAKWYLEYYKTYGEDEWVRLNRKPSKITLDVSQTEDGFIIKKVTPYYATKSRSGNAGTLTETYEVTKDRVKSSLEFNTPYTSRDWRVIWNVKPNIEVIEDRAEFLKLEKQLNIFYSDPLLDYRIDDDAFYKVQPGNFKIDPLVQFGNLTELGTMGSFRYGFCSECDNLGNVSYSPGSSAVQATYESGWDLSYDLQTPVNFTSSCTDPAGAGFCELSLRNGSEIIPSNDSDTITRCLFNQSAICYGGGGFGSRDGRGSGFDFLPGGINNFDGLHINDSDTFFLKMNETNTSAEWTANNFTINASGGYLDIMVKFE